MTSTVIHMTHCVDIELVARLFARFRGRYGNLWTSRAICDEDWEFIMEDWLEELTKFTIEQVRLAVNKTLLEFTTYPPTLGQLVELCMKESGVPESHEVVSLMVAREFSHPIVKIIYEKVGSWMLNNGKNEDIERKVKECYTSSKSEFYIDPQKAWLDLEYFNTKPKELPSPDKIPTNEERIDFKERRAEYQIKVDEEKENLKDKRQREFDYSKLKPGSRDFDKLLFSEYQAYLVGIPETMVLSLSANDAYARMKFISMIEQTENLKNIGYVSKNQQEGLTSNKTSYRNGQPTKVYKSWTND